MCDELRIPYPAGTTSPKELVDRLHRHLLEAHAARPAHRPHHRRGAESRARGAGGGAPPHEPRDRPGEAPPGDPDRPAGAGGDPRAAEAAPARPARHGSVSSRAALAAGDRLRTSATGSRVAGRGRAGVHGGARCGRCTAGRAAFPRLINAIADRALLGAYTRERSQVDAATVRRAAAEVLGQAPTAWQRWARRRRRGGPRRRHRRRSDSCSSRRARSGGDDVGRETACRAFRVPRSPAGSRCWRRADRGGTPVRPGPASRGRAPGSRRPGHEGRRPRRPAGPVGRAGCGDAAGLRAAHPRGRSSASRRSAPGRSSVDSIFRPCSSSPAPGGERRYGVLTALTPSEATLRFGDRVVTALAGRRSSHSGTAPSSSSGVRRPASFRSGEARGALRPTGSGSAWRGAPAPVCRSSRGRPYDQGLWERVTAFQQARSLEPDGVVGHETAIVLRGRSGGPTCRGSPPGCRRRPAVSYILDALRKAERDRQVSRVPTLATAHGGADLFRRPHWAWAVAAGAVALGGVVHRTAFGRRRPCDRIRRRSPRSRRLRRRRRPTRR